jgi:pantetheine-phosphate adenylyltransferase
MSVIAIFPGTFDPIHNGHIDIARRAAAIFDEVIVAVYDKPLKSLMFAPEERLQMVREALDGENGLRVMGYSGLTVEFCQAVGAKVIVRGLRVFSDFEHEFRMALANHRLAPEIEVCALVTREEHTFLSSSTVREIASLGGDVSSMAPPFVVAALQRHFRELGDERGRAAAPMTSLRD